MSRRGATGPGRPAGLPAATYTPPAPVEVGDDQTLTVLFHGEDGRRTRFRVGELPLPEWHRALAAAFAARTGPAGTIRTLAAARGEWDNLQRFIRVLAQLPGSPRVPGDLLRGHVEQFIARRRASRSDATLLAELRSLGNILRQAPLADQIRPEALEPLIQRRHKVPHPGRPGYTDREFTELLAAARADVAAIRARLAAGEALLAAGRTPEAEDDVDLGSEWFSGMATSGAVPRDSRGQQFIRMRRRRSWAGHLFLTWPDVTSLLVLLVAATGRNVETVKELPVEHRVLEGHAVELQLTKRRRGARRWRETVTWEIGPPHRELHTPGGLYLLVHRLAARGREFSGTSSVWSIWRNGGYIDKHGADEHFDPFRHGLHSHSYYLRDWAAIHAARDTSGEPDAARLGPQVDFLRLKTSIDVRRTRQMGGHLPSAARSNSYSVLFTNYLRDDPTTIDWARDVLDDALLDAEHAALDAHRRALAATSGQDELTTRHDPAGTDVGAETGWSSCDDPEHHPVTGATCQASLLDCFHCSNATITPAHLPRLLALLDALQHRQAQLPEAEWWSRYGPTWAAIRHDVLTKFSPVELDRAAADKPDDALLDLVEPPWEHP